MIPSGKTSGWIALCAGFVASAQILYGSGAVVQAPAYTAEGIVNAASYTADGLAPNTIASIFGTNLAFKTKAVTQADFQNDGLPTSFGNVTVYVGGVFAGIYYVSPTQINFLIPDLLQAGTTTVSVVRDGVAGPAIPIVLKNAGPGLFYLNQTELIATHADGTLITDDSPAAAGEWVIVYAAGLGRTTPEAPTYGLAAGPAVIRALSSLQVILDGKAVDESAIYYAGLTPGYAGLYQVNVQLPPWMNSHPEFKLSIGDSQSQAGMHLSTF